MVQHNYMGMVWVIYQHGSITHEASAPSNANPSCVCSSSNLITTTLYIKQDDEKCHYDSTKKERKGKTSGWLINSIS